MYNSQLVDIALVDSPVYPSPLVFMAVGLGGYLLGSVPFGLVLTRLAGIDLRKIGSGNIGATNVLRTGRKDLAAMTLVLDSGKGAMAVLVAWLSLGPGLLPLIAGVAAVVGHNFPLWLRLKGGKGVATTMGVLLATAWPVGVTAILTWLLVALVSRLSSLAALLALALAPAYALLMSDNQHAIGFMGLAVLGWMRHEDNLRRLWAGTESKIEIKFPGQKKPEETITTPLAAPAGKPAAAPPLATKSNPAKASVTKK